MFMKVRYDAVIKKRFHEGNAILTKIHDSDERRFAAEMNTRSFVSNAILNKIHFSDDNKIQFSNEHKIFLLAMHIQQKCGKNMGKVIAKSF